MQYGQYIKSITTLKRVHRCSWLVIIVWSLRQTSQ